VRHHGPRGDEPSPRLFPTSVPTCFVFHPLVGSMHFLQEARLLNFFLIWGCEMESHLSWRETQNRPPDAQAHSVCSLGPSGTREAALLLSLKLSTPSHLRSVFEFLGIRPNSKLGIFLSSHDDDPISSRRLSRRLHRRPDDPTRVAAQRQGNVPLPLWHQVS